MYLNKMEKKSTEITPGIVREMGFLEKMMKSYHDKSICILSNALWIVSKVELTDSLIHKALERLSLKIPQLRFYIQENTGDDDSISSYFAEIRDFHVDFEVLDTKDWIGVISREWETPFNCERGPLWRVKWLPNVRLDKKDDTFRYENVVIISCCHAVLDGMSYQRVFGHFLDCLEEIHNNNVESPVPLQVLPALEHYLDIKPSVTEKLLSLVLKGILKTESGRKYFMSLAFGGRHAYLNSVPAVLEEDPSVAHTSSFIPMEFSQEETSYILRSCKARNLTVNGALYAASFLAFLRCLPVKKSHSTVNGICYINIRRHLTELQGLDHDSIGVFVYECKIVPKVKSIEETSHSFWSLAKDTNLQVRKFVETQRYITESKQADMLLSSLEDNMRKLTELIVNGPRYGRASCISVTNMGKCDFLTRPNSSNFKLVGRFGGGGDFNFGSILTHNLNTFNGKIYWSIIYSKHIIRKERVEECARGIKEILQKFCGETCL